MVRDDSFVPLIKIKNMIKDLLDVKGIIISTETGRIYPLGEAASFSWLYSKCIRKSRT